MMLPHFLLVVNGIFTVKEFLCLYPDRQRTVAAESPLYLHRLLRLLTRLFFFRLSLFICFQAVGQWVSPLCVYLSLGRSAAFPGRGHPQYTFMGAVKGGIVSEAAVLRSLSSHDSSGNQLLCHQYPFPYHIFHNGDAGILLESVTQIIFTDKKMLRKSV